MSSKSTQPPIEGESGDLNVLPDAPGWELFKENAQPLKKGRDANRLGKTLTARAASLPSAADSVPKMEEFEASVTSEALSVSLDPLGIWIRYINWIRDEHPSGSDVIELMERCTRAFTHDPRFRNDERFIKVLQLAFFKSRHLV
jgi:hypothetical protein